VKHIVRQPRQPARAKFTRELARTRPKRLDPDAPPSVIWPPPTQFTQLPRPPATTSHPAASARRSRRLRRPPPSPRPTRPSGPGTLRRKLLSAVSSALAISAVLTFAVTIGGEQGHKAGRSATSGHNQRGGTPSGNAPISFQRLPLIRPWRGRIEFGIRDGVVYLTGFAAIHASSSTAITILPSSIRPRTQLDLPVAAAPIAALTIQITPTGIVRALLGSQVVHVDRIWLSGVSFPIRN
jgi:hypothetical protein